MKMFSWPCIISVINFIEVSKKLSSFILKKSRQGIKKEPHLREKQSKMGVYVINKFLSSYQYILDI
jgi:hypothetical protein